MHSEKPYNHTHNSLPLEEDVRTTQRYKYLLWSQAVGLLSNMVKFLALVSLFFFLYEVKSNNFHHRPTSPYNKLPLIWNYPEAHEEHTQETIFGQKVKDPFRWLEDQNSNRTVAFRDAQNKLVDQYLNQFNHTNVIRKNLIKLYNQTADAKVDEHGDYFYFQQRKNLKGNAILYRKKGEKGIPQVIVNPNTMSPNETAFIKFLSFSEDDKQFAYGISRKGSDWTIIYVRKNTEKSEVTDKVIWTKDGNIVWSKDNKGFFYTSLPVPKKVALEDAGIDKGPILNSKLRYHVIGTNQEEDLIIWEDKKNPVYSASVEYAGSNGEYLVLYVGKSTANVNQLWYADAKKLNDTGIIKPIKFDHAVDNFNGGITYVDTVDNSTHYFIDTRDAPFGKVITAKLEKFSKASTFLAERNGFGLQTVKIGKNKVIVSYIRKARFHIKVFDKKDNKKELIDVKLPIGDLKSFKLSKDESSILFNSTDAFYTEKSYEVDLNDQHKTLKLTHTKPILPGSTPDAFETRLLKYKSKDGTEIPITLIYRKGIVKNKKNHVYLYGYGGFNVINSLGVRPHWISMLQSFDMMIAVAHIRGGGENGEPWFRDGADMNKQNSYDDFQSAAKWLVKEKYTTRDRIVANGRSNGGTLSAVSFIQAPELFGAVVADVGVMDLLRFQKFTWGTTWYDDFGNSLYNATEFHNTLKFSPYHNVKMNKSLPPILITTGDHDDRVSPLHSYKLAARLQSYYRTYNQPILLQTTLNAGHGCGGCGKPVGLEISDKTKMLTFIAMTFNISPKEL